MSTSIEINSVIQRFQVGFWLKEVQILNGISFNVPKGSIFGLLGANGAGKTTLIKLVAGLRKPTSGSIKVSGHEAYKYQAKLRIGFMPERPYFHEHLTGTDLLWHMGTLAGMSKADLETRVRSVLETVGVWHAKNRELKNYSKGMLQRIGIAQAIIHDPEIIVLDEPMSGLDPVGRKDMRDLIAKLADQGKTVFFSSHIIEDIEILCNEIALLKKGDLIGTGPVSKFVESSLRRYEILFNGHAPKDESTLLEEFESHRDVPEGKLGIISPKKDINPILERLLSKKANIVSLTPVRPTLEDFYKEMNL